MNVLLLLLLFSFFEKQFYRIKDENVLIENENEIPVYRDYSGIEHNLDDVDLSEDDQRILDCNDFERQFQQKQNEMTQKLLDDQITASTTNSNKKDVDTESNEDSDKDSELLKIEKFLRSDDESD